jgi:hypothetical protein
MPAGRPKKELPAELYESTIVDLASKGLSHDQIAHCLAMGKDAFIARRNENPEIDRWIERGRALGVKTVTNALFNNAVEHNNTTAQIFYLKNRAPEDWNDRKEHLHTVRGSIELSSDIDRANRLAQLLNQATEREVQGERLTHQSDNA